MAELASATPAMPQSSSSMRIPLPQNFEDGPAKNITVQTKACVLCIPEIEMDTARHELYCRRFPTQPMDLSPTGNTRLDVLPNLIMFDELCINVVMRDCMRSRPDQGHIPNENIDELRKFIQTC